MTSALPVPATVPTTAWTAVLAATTAGLAVSLNVGKVPVALPLLRSELGLSLVQAGWVSSVLSTAAVIGAAAVGMWVGRLGALRMVLAGLLFSGVASASAAVVDGGWHFLLATRLLEGLGFMVVVVSCPALIMAATQASQARMALGIWSTYMPAGASLAMASAPWLLPQAGWRGLWALTALALGLAAAALWTQRRHFRDEPQLRAQPTPSFWLPVGQMLGQLQPWMLALAFGAWATQHFAIIIWLPTYLVEQRELAAAPVALLTAFMLLACVPGNLLGGWLLQRGWSRGRLIAWAQLATGVGALLYNQGALPDGLRYAACVAVSFIGGLIPAAVLSSSSSLARTPQQVGLLQGLFLQGSQLGQFAGTPLIAAAVAASGHWSSALWVTLSASALGVVLGLALLRHENKTMALLAERPGPTNRN